MKARMSFFVVVTIWALVSISCGSSSPTPQKIGDATAISSGSTSTPVQLQVYKVGDMVQIGDLVLTVNGYEVTQGDETWHPDDGHKYIIVDVTIENKGGEPKVIASLMQMALKDDTGMEYSEDMGADISAGNTTPSGEIVPGDKIRGKIGFDVSEEAKGFRFVFDASLFSSGKIFVELGE